MLSSTRAELGSRRPNARLRCTKTRSDHHPDQLHFLGREADPAKPDESTLVVVRCSAATRSGSARALSTESTPARRAATAPWASESRSNCGVQDKDAP